MDIFYLILSQSSHEDNKWRCQKWHLKIEQNNTKHEICVEQILLKLSANWQMSICGHLEKQSQVKCQLDANINHRSLITSYMDIWTTQHKENFQF